MFSIFKFLLLVILIIWGFSIVPEKVVKNQIENVVAGHKYIVEAKDQLTGKIDELFFNRKRKIGEEETEGGEK